MSARRHVFTKYITAWWTEWLEFTRWLWGAIALYIIAVEIINPDEPWGWDHIFNMSALCFLAWTCHKVAMKALREESSDV